MTVGELAARMESVPSLKPTLTSQLPEHAWEKDIYKKVKNIHATYLKELKTINIKELIDRQTE